MRIPDSLSWRLERLQLWLCRRGLFPFREQMNHWTWGCKPHTGEPLSCVFPTREALERSGAFTAADNPPWDPDSKVVH